jgi:hypothetical protein
VGKKSIRWRLGAMKNEFTKPDRFVAGTVGEPGERAFYLQVLSLIHI